MVFDISALQMKIDFLEYDIDLKFDFDIFGIFIFASTIYTFCENLKKIGFGVGLLFNFERGKKTRTPLRRFRPAIFERDIFRSIFGLQHLAYNN